MRSLFLLSSFLWLPFVSLRAQPAFYTFSPLAVEHGLSQNTVYCMSQDSRGFLWIGTADGLNRYDGHGFKVFKHNPEDSNSLSNSVIRGIFEDRSGKLWITTEKGLNIYDPAGEKFRQVNITSRDTNSGYWDLVLAQGEGGMLWIWRCGQALIEYDPARNSSREYPFRGYYTVYQRFSYFDQAKQKLWISTRDTLSCFDIPGKKFSHFPLPMPSETEGTSMQACQNRYLLIAAESGIQVFDLIKNTFVSDAPFVNIRYSPMRVKAIELDRHGHLWVISYDKGIKIYDSSGAKLAEYTPRQNCDGCLKANLLTVAVQDSGGNIWLGADGTGMHRVHGLKAKFNQLLARDRNPYGFSDNLIRAITEDRHGLLWVGTLAGGVDILDRETGNMRHLNTKTKPALPSDNIFSLVEDRYGRIWIATAAGVCVFDPKTEKLEIIPIDEPFDVFRRVSQIKERSNGEIWMTFKGVGLLYGRFEPGGKPEFRLYEPSRGKNFSTLYEDRDRNLWAVNPQEILIVNPANKPVSYLWNKNMANYAAKNFTTTVCEDAFGNIWLGSHSGVARIERKTGELAYLNENNGLANNYVYDILADKSGHVWVSSNKGLSRIDARTLEVRNYELKDGLQSYEFNSKACYKSRTGIFYWGGVYGINYFHPDSVKDDSFSPRLSVTGFGINEKEERLSAWMDKHGKLDFSHNQNYFYFQFAAPDLTYPGTVRYAYRLDGLDRQWHYIGNQNFVRLNGLGAGTYRLEIKATNSDGIWNSNVLTYTIRINPPYWDTTWFRILIALSAMCFVAVSAAWYYRQRYKSRLAELRRKQEIEEIRNRISRDIHDEIGSGLTRISIIAERLQRNVTGQADGISRALESLQVQSRNIAGSLNEIIWTVNPLNDRLDSLMAYIRHYAADYLENGGLDYYFDFPDEIPETVVRPELRRNLFLVVKESLNNIVKYADATRVTMKFGVDENGAFTLSITDNGKGMEPDKKVKGGGNGLRNMQSRMTEIGGECMITSEPGKGVRIDISGTVGANTTF